MSDYSATPSTKEADQETGAAVARPNGRPPGTPKSGGRVRGSRNKRSRIVEEAFAPHGAKARKALVALLSDPNAETRYKAAMAILAYLHGKPRERTELSGPDGAPISSRTRVDSGETLHATARAVAEMALLASAQARGKAP